MRDVELEALAGDIAEKGLLNPVVLLDGKVLDGRNRLRACAKAGVEPLFTKWHENGLSALDFVIAQNLQRRDLTFDQRVALAAKLVPMFAAQARKRVGGRPRKDEKPSATRREVSGKAADLASRTTGVSARSVERVLALEKKHPGTLDRLVSGEITLLEANREAFYRGPFAERFVAPPFTVLDTRQGYWQHRKREWYALGGARGLFDMQSHVSAPTDLVSFNDRYKDERHTSSFDPVLAELIYRWFCPPRGRVLDPFAGEATTGIVASKLGYRYTGVELRSQQVAENRKHATRIGVDAKWYCGDSAELSKHVPDKEAFDLVFTSPPYYNLERYNGGPKDGSALDSYDAFTVWYELVFRQVTARLKRNRFVVVKVGEIRDDKGFYRNFVGDTIRCFQRVGLKYYNEIILVTQSGSAALRVGGQFSTFRKPVHTHQNILCFWKGDNPKLIPQELGVLDNSVNSVGR
jgi:DNA modification methylase